ncbi:MAG: dihydropyrimidinase [Elusimicrobiota bacterium]
MTRYDTLIKNGTILNASNSFKGDVAVQGETIAGVGDIKGEAATVIDAKGCFVMPGGVDVHTHLDMPLGDITTADDFAAGTLAAALGGTTTIVDYAAQTKGQSLLKGLEEWHKKADGKAVTDYGFHMTLAEFTDGTGPEMDRLVQEGVTTFKVFMAYPGRFMLGDGDIFRVMLRAKENGGMALVHAENGPVIDELVRRALAEGNTKPKHHALTRPMEAEAEAVHRALALGAMAKAPVYIVHLSAALSLEHVRRAREAGQNAFAETCPQYLFLSDEAYDGPDAEAFIMSPPLRPRGNERKLWEGLKKGWIQTVATDHCSFTLEQKKGKPDFTKIPGGVAGVGARVPLLWDAAARGKLTRNRFVDLVSTTPAKLFGLYPRKGIISRGSDADLVIIDPKKKQVLSGRPYGGRELRGAVKEVLIRGRRVLVPNPPKGVFLKRQPNL